MWTIDSLALLWATFLAAGFVKGIVGLGMPTIVLGVAVPIFGLETGIALMLIPALVTNVWQALSGSATRALAIRLWPMLAMICFGIAIGVNSLVHADPRIASAMLGALIAIHSTISLVSPNLPNPGRHEVWLTPALGFVNGVITGFTGSSVMPAALYLQALSLKKDHFVQAIGMIFSVSVFVLTLALASFAVLTIELALLSSSGLIPAFIGMGLGTRLRSRISEQRFRRFLLLVLIVIGLNVIVRAMIG